MVGFFERTGLPFLTPIMNQISEAVCVIQSTGTIVYQNLAANLILGGDYQGRLIEDLTDLHIVGPREQPLSLREFFLGDERHTRPSPEEGYRIWSTRTGRSAWVQAMMSRHTCPTSGAGFIVFTMRNVTPEKREMDHLNQVKQGLESLNRAKMEFFARVSHEIRTPLSTILGFTEMLAAHSLPEEERQFYRKVIERNGTILMRLLDDILDMAKIEAQTFSVRKTVFDLMKELHPLLYNLQNRAWEKGLVFQVQVSRNVPERIHSDPVRLSQILTNLIDNAIKFTHKGAIRLRIHLEEHEHPHLEFLVSDTGTGIPKEQLDHLFHPFDQFDTDLTHRSEGAGLGLPLAKRLARALGGDVELLRSIPTRGTVFRVAIDPDLEACGGSQENLTHEPGPESPAATPLLGLHALVVEDGADNRYLFTTLLEQEGMIVETATNGAEALKKLSDHSYDVTLMDLQMPLMDGYTAAREIRRRGYELPIIAITAHAMKDEAQRCQEAGFNGFLAKPVTKTELTETISRFATPRGQESSAPMDLAPTLAEDPAMKPVLRSIFERLDAQLNELRAATQSLSQAPQVPHLAHRLKGTLTGCGFPFLSELAQKIEDHARRGRKRECHEMIGKLRSEIDRLRRLGSPEAPFDAAFKLSS